MMPAHHGLAAVMRGSGQRLPRDRPVANPEGHVYTSAHVGCGAKLGKYLGAKDSCYRSRAPLPPPAKQA